MTLAYSDKMNRATVRELGQYEFKRQFNHMHVNIVLQINSKAGQSNLRSHFIVSHFDVCDVHVASV